MEGPSDARVDMPSPMSNGEGHRGMFLLCEIQIVLVSDTIWPSYDLKTGLPISQMAPPGGQQTPYLNSEWSITLN